VRERLDSYLTQADDKIKTGIMANQEYGWGMKKVIWGVEDADKNRKKDEKWGDRKEATKDYSEMYPYLMKKPFFDVSFDCQSCGKKQSKEKEHGGNGVSYIMWYLHGRNFTNILCVECAYEIASGIFALDKQRQGRWPSMEKEGKGDGEN